MQRAGNTKNGMYEIMHDLFHMPRVMRQLAVVQFFSWFALFAMWIYGTAAVTSYHFGATDVTSAAYNDGADWNGVLFAVYNGFAALAAVIVLGPRIGRFAEKGKNPFPPHSIAIATLGVFILWVGWYGFNPGSQLAFTGAANTDITMLVAVNTTLAAGGGALLAMISGWISEPCSTIRFNAPRMRSFLASGLKGVLSIPLFLTDKSSRR